MTQQLVAPPATAPASSRWNGPIRVSAAIMAVVVLGFGVGSVIGYFMIRTSTETAFFTNPVTRVQVTGDTGNVVIRAGTAAGSATVISRSQSAFRTARHSEKVVDGVLQVRGFCEGGLFIADTCSVDFEIEVPPGTAVQARTATGDLTVSDTSGPVTASSSTGSIRVTQVGGGPVRLSTNVGDITGYALTGGTVDGNSNTGDVRLNFSAAPDRIRAHTDVGDVRVQVPDDATGYRVTADVIVGERYVDVPTDPGSSRVMLLSTNTGDVRVGLLNP